MAQELQLVTSDRSSVCCENFDPFLSFIKWHYKPKYDNLSRNFTFTWSLRGSGEGDGVRVDSKEVCVLIYYWWGTWTNHRASASAIADATVTPSHPLVCCRMSCFSVFNYLVFTPNGVITPNCVLLHQNVYFFSKANSFIKFHKLSILKAPGSDLWVTERAVATAKFAVATKSLGLHHLV